MKMNYWTDEEDKIVINLLGKNNYETISSILKTRTAQAIRSRVEKKLKLHNPFHPRIWFHDENFWSVPNTLNSYWAGFMAADGCVVKEYNGKPVNKFACGLSTKDEHHLQLFKKMVKYNGDLKYRTKKSPSSDNLVNSVHLNIFGKRWIQDLDTNFNITQNKTYRIGPPNLLKDEHLFPFLTGYLDGDGCISKINDGRITIVFVSGSKKLLLWIKEFVDKRFTYQYGNREQNLTFTTSSKNKKCLRLAFNGYKAALIFDYMRHVPVPKLSRKWENPAILEAVEKYKAKKPDLFNFDLLPSYDSYLKFLPEITQESVSLELEYNDMKKRKEKIAKETENTNVNPPIANIRSIEDFLGLTKNKYSNKTLDQYTNYLQQLTDFELETHAHDLDFTHLTDRETTISELIKLYKKDSDRRGDPGKNAQPQLITPELNKKLTELMRLV